MDMPVKELSEFQIKAMESLFEFEEAMTDGELCLDDLAEVMKLAIKDGWDMLYVALLMAITALKVLEPTPFLARLKEELPREDSNLQPSP